MDLPETIYHYCSPHVALTILEKRSLWLTSTSNLNDYAEVVWAQRIIDDQLANYDGDIQASDLDRLRTMLGANAGHFFISCLSKEGDLLSQWRAYAANGSGIAIGFDPKQLVTEDDVHWGVKPNNLPGIAICKIQYQASLQEKTVRDIIELWARGPAAHGITGSFSADSTQMYLNSLQIQFKNPAFAEEKEYRLVTSPLMLYGPDDEFPVTKMEVMDTNPVSKLKHHSANGRITAYFDSSFPASAVTKIILGPKNEFTEFDLVSFLNSNDLRHVDVSRSTATYR